MVREDLIASAVSFLQDPSVASSAIEKRRSFLESKNLTQEEIDIALARAGEPGQAAAAGYGYPSQQPMRSTPQAGYGYGYNGYPQGPWPQQPMQPPQRDWRDWFIMATVTTGVGYGLYAVAKRYVMPLIAPPTPPQLEQDKSAVDASFAKAFALIDQLATDTAALKSAEAERTQKLDAALADVENVITDLKTANKRREDESRRLGDDVRALKDMIPKALEGWKSEGDSRLKDLGTELKSLKMLLGNRVGGVSTPVSSASRPPAAPSQSFTNGVINSGTVLGSGPSYPSSTVAETQNNIAPAPGIATVNQTSLSAFTMDKKPVGRAIPAWQMAASSNNDEARQPTVEQSTSP